MRDAFALNFKVGYNIGVPVYYPRTQPHLEKTMLDEKARKRSTDPGLGALRDPVVEESLRKMDEEYGKYASSASEVRAIMGKRLGGRTLKEVLRELDDKE